MSDETASDDLFADGGDDETLVDYGQDGPDLFGLEPDEAFVAHEPNALASLDLDVDQDESGEIPIDPGDEPENQVTPAEMQAVSDVEFEDEPANDADDAAVLGNVPASSEQSLEEPLAEHASDTPGPSEASEASEAPETAELARAEAPAGPLGGAPSMERPDAPLALYRRYRPDTFADVIGQDHVTEPLRRALINNRVNHAYLFSGPRGCGKTTSARILARCLNCEQGPTPEPCGECQSCRDLARGGTGSIDVIEIDAASHGGVDDARDLRERAFFAPVHSRYKIYIIDEAHMVTAQGFNALLKLVEEPPPHVKFIFATTEPEKVIGTIRSRTHHYPFRLVPPKTLSGYLAKLCDEEGVRVDPTVLPLVVRAGAGSVRDSLSVLDQLLGGAGEQGVSYRQATALLGYTPDTLLDEIVDAFAAGDSAGVFACIDKVIEVGQDPRRFAEDLLRRLRDLIIVAAVPDALTTGLVDVAGDQAERLTVQAQGLGAGELTRAAEVIAKGLTDMRGTTAPRLHLELMCSRVLLPGADVDARGIHARLDRLERRLNMVGDLPPGASGDPAPAPGEAVASNAYAGPSGAPDAPVEADFEPGGGLAAARAAARAARGEVPGRADAPVRGEKHGREQGAASGEAPQATRHPAPASGGSGGGWAADWTPDRPPAGHGGYSDERAFRAPERPEQGGSEPRPAPRDPAPGTEQGASPRARGTDQGQPSGAPQAPEPALGRDAANLETADVRRLWPEVLDAVKSRRRVTWIVLSQNAQVQSYTDEVLTLAMSSAGARESFGRGGSPDILREALIQVLGVAPTIETVVGGGGPTPPPPGTTPSGPRGGRVPARQQAQQRGPQGHESHGAGGRAAAAERGRAALADEPASQQGPSGSDVTGQTAPGEPSPVMSAREAGPSSPYTPEPPPEEDDYERPDFASLARANIHRAQSQGVASEDEVEQGRDDLDLVEVDDVDELLKKELGAELIVEDPPQV